MDIHWLVIRFFLIQINTSVIRFTIIDSWRPLTHKGEHLILKSTPLVRCVCVCVRWEIGKPDLGGDCKDTLATYPWIAVTFQFNGWCVALWMIAWNGNRTQRENWMCVSKGCYHAWVYCSLLKPLLVCCCSSRRTHLLLFPSQKQGAYLSAFSAGKPATSIRRAFQTFVLLYFTSSELLKLKVAIHWTEDNVSCTHSE